MKYNSYDLKYKYKIVPEGKTDDVYFWYGLYGSTLAEAIEHAEFWAESELEKTANMDILSVTVDYKCYQWENPYELEKAVKYALAAKENAEEIVNKSDLDNYDKAELIANIRIGEPWRFGEMDTALRDHFCDLLKH